MSDILFSMPGLDRRRFRILSFYSELLMGSARVSQVDVTVGKCSWINHVTVVSDYDVTVTLVGRSVPVYPLSSFILLASERLGRKRIEQRPALNAGKSAAAEVGDGAIVGRFVHRASEDLKTTVTNGVLLLIFTANRWIYKSAK